MALSRPSEWVPKLGPKFRREGASFRLQAEWRGGDGYNVSVHKRGIKDFASGKRMSAIDLVMAALDTKDYQALNWLKDKLGIVEPEAKSEPSADGATTSAAKTQEQKTNNDVPTKDLVASSFAEQRGGDLKFCHHAGRWYEWFGGVWRVNETGIVLQRIRELSRAMSSDAGPKIQAAVNKVSFSRGAESFCKVHTYIRCHVGALGQGPDVARHAGRDRGSAHRRVARERSSRRYNKVGRRLAGEGRHLPYMATLPARGYRR